MKLTKVQLAKLAVKIHALEKEANLLESKARAADASFYESAKTYGSELAGSSGTEHTYKTVKLMRQLAEFLRGIKSGTIPWSNFDATKRRLEEVGTQIKSLTEEKNDLQLRLSRFEACRKLISL